MSDLIVGLYEDWLWLDERIEVLEFIGSRCSTHDEPAPNCHLSWLGRIRDYYEH